MRPKITLSYSLASDCYFIQFHHHLSTRVRPMYTSEWSDIENRQHWSLLEHQRIGVGKSTMSILSKIVVVLWPPTFHCHRSGWLPSNLTVLSVVFLGAVSWKLPLTIPPSCDSHLNAASFDPAWMHGDTALSPPLAPASPLFTDHLCLQLSGQPGRSQCSLI